MYNLLRLLLSPLVAQAVGEGAWQASGMRITLNHRGQSASSDPLVLSQPVPGLMTLVAWRYELNGPTSTGLQVRLCSQSRCVELDGQGGTTNRFNNVPTIELMHFIWEVLGGGRLVPALRAQSNQAIMSYR